MTPRHVHCRQTHAHWKESEVHNTHWSHTHIERSLRYTKRTGHTRTLKGVWGPQHALLSSASGLTNRFGRWATELQKWRTLSHWTQTAEGRHHWLATGSRTSLVSSDCRRQRRSEGRFRDKTHTCVMSSKRREKSRRSNAGHRRAECASTRRGCCACSPGDHGGHYGIELDTTTSKWVLQRQSWRHDRSCTCYCLVTWRHIVQRSSCLVTWQQRLQLMRNTRPLARVMTVIT
jgi:hypothetical protein